MKVQRQIFLLTLALILTALLSAASTVQIAQKTTEKPSDEMLTLIGNPAAVYCQTLMGYDYEITTQDDGSQKGVCTMPDGESCEQWDFYAGTCGANHGYCQQQGYDLRTEEKGADPFARTYSVCYDTETRESFPISNLISEEATCDASTQDAQLMLPPPDESAQTSQAAPGQVGLAQAPGSFDWRSVNGSNWLTGVKNQASCGGCWSFATMGVVEGSNNILNNDPTLDQNLSEQLMISTCPTYGEPGDCGGGHAWMALNIAASDGVVDEACMPFLVGNSDCSTRCSDWASRLTYAKNSVWGYLTLTPAKLKEYISRHGPVTVYMGINSAFGGYWDGDIYRCSDDSSINHAVVAVGYNDAEQYWIIRNSWGSSWNGDGYFKVGYGECMIDTYLYSFVDTKPPDSSHSLSGTLGENGWYTSDITVNVSSSDPYGSGLAYMEHHLNSAAWTKVYSTSTSITVSTDGNHSFYYRAKDQGGNLESTHTVALKRDTASPTNPSSVTETACGATSGVEINCTDPAFSWNTGTDATSGVQGYGVYFGTSSSGADSSSFTTSLGHDPGTLAPGTYYLRLRTKDNAGNWSAWATSFTLIVDSTAPPVTTHNLSGTLGENDWYTSDITIALSATPAEGQTIDYIEYHFNSDAWTQVQSSSTSTSLTADGTHSFSYRAADEAGNLESTHTITLKRDAAAPTNPSSVTETACGATSGVSTSCTDPAFSWNTGTDATSGVQGYGVYFGTSSSGTDSGSFITTPGHDPGALSPGTYYLRLRTKDNAGNWSGWVTKFTLIIDSGEAPVTTHSLSGTLGENDWYTSNITVTLNATPASGHSIDYIEYHFNSNAWTQVHSSSTSTNQTSDGISSFYYRAADTVGNIETTHAITLKRDATNPVNTNSASETACGAISGLATTCSDPAFSWLAGYDSTSGVQGYGVYFGSNPTGTDSGTFTTLQTFDPGPVSSGTYYLRLRTKDMAGNWSDWATRFTLIVDAGDAPVTTYDLYGSLGQNGWYVSDISASLNASAAEGKTISYIEHQLNSGNWNKVYSSSATASITADGQHAFNFHAVDNAGAVETIQTITLKRDVTSPSNPDAAFETNCGAANGAATTCTYPTFMWTAGSDATSGVQGYGVYFGNDPNGTNNGYFTNGQYHEPGTVSPGTYYLRLRTRDNAGNWSGWVTKFVFDSRTTSPGKMYIPLVVLSPEPTPPVTHLKNGDFEAGNDGSWDVFSSHGWPLIYEFSAGGTHSGTWLAWLGDDADETSRLSQSATVPTDSPYLHYWSMIYSDDECGYDYVAVKVNGSTFKLTSLCESTTTNWTESIIDLSIYQGQTVTITFEVTTDSMVHSSYYLDDVAFGSSQPAAPADETPDTDLPTWIGQHKSDFE